MSTAERIDLPGTFNFRDAGGYPTPDGTVRTGVLYRSDGLGSLGDAGRSKLVGLDVHTVIDLPDEFEIELSPDDLDDLAIERIHLPLFEGSSTSAGVIGAGLAQVYEQIVTLHPGVVVSAIRHIARADEGAVVVHCTAGKGRTGVIIALVLLAVGVDRGNVVDDYAASQGNLAGPWLEGMLATISEHGIADTPQLRVLLGGSPPEALGQMIDLVEKQHGSIRNYLLSAGLTVEELALLHARLVRVIQ